MGGSHAGGSGGPHDVSLLGPIGGHRSTVKTAFKIAEGAGGGKCDPFRTAPLPTAAGSCGILGTGITE